MDRIKGLNDFALRSLEIASKSTPPIFPKRAGELAFSIEAKCYLMSESA